MPLSKMNHELTNSSLYQITILSCWSVHDSLS